MSVTNADLLAPSQTVPVTMSGVQVKAVHRTADARSVGGNTTRRKNAARTPESPKRRFDMRIRFTFLTLVITAFVACQVHADPWIRHTIDGSSRGADGVRTSDVNGDGLTDLTTGWEEGGVIRVYLNPGAEKAKMPWPAVTVGTVKSPEDAVFADVDGDGAVDVVSSCEGKTRRIFVHWAPTNPSDYLSEEKWQTQSLPCAEIDQMWMFCLPMQVDGKNGVDLVVGSKGTNASIGWLQAPANPRDVAAWTYHRLYDAGWIMSLIARDMDADGDLDVLASDRKGPSRSVLWLRNPGPTEAANNTPWTVNRIGATDREVMFLGVGDNQGEFAGSIIAACRGSGFALLSPPDWSLTDIPMPENCGTGKGVAVRDIDLDGHTDIVFTCENATGDKSGCRWLTRDASGRWLDHEISGPEGVKFDRIELLDLDADGDLDLITCEERTNLGVIWYENPAR